MKFILFTNLQLVAGGVFIRSLDALFRNSFYYLFFASIEVHNSISRLLFCFVFIHFDYVRCDALTHFDENCVIRRYTWSHRLNRCFCILYLQNTYIRSTTNNRQSHRTFNVENKVPYVFEYEYEYANFEMLQLNTSYPIHSLFLYTLNDLICDAYENCRKKSDKFYEMKNYSHETIWIITASL